MSSNASVNASADFLRKWSDGPYSVGAIHPITNHTKWLTGDIYEISVFIDKFADAGFNLYFQPNTCAPAKEQRVSKSSVVYATCLQVEIDPPKDITTAEALNEWQTKWILDLDTWTFAHPRPTVSYFSGTGFVCLWKLDIPVALQENGEFFRDRATAVEGRNRHLVQLMEGDSASTDVSRLLRLPWTMNIPGATKIAKGRTEATQSEIIFYDETRTVALAMFSSTIEISSTPRQIVTSDDIKRQQAINLIGKSWPQTERHRAHLVLTGVLARLQWSEDDIVDFVVRVAEIQQPGNGEEYKRRITTKQTIEKLQRNEQIPGWTKFFELVTEPVGKVVKELLDPDNIFSNSFFEELGKVKEEEALYSEVEACAREATRAKSKLSAQEKSYIAKLLAQKPLVEPGEDLSTAIDRAITTVVKVSPSNASAKTISILFKEIGSFSGHTVIERIQKALDETKAASKKTEDTTLKEWYTQEQLKTMAFAVSMSGNDIGKPNPNSSLNYDIALARRDITFKLNIFSNEKILCRKDDKTEIVNDLNIIRIMTDIERQHGFYPNKEKFFDHIKSLSGQNEFHPVRDYFNELPTWDRVSRTETWLIDYAQAPDTVLTRAISRIVLIAAVRRIRQPGCKFDEMLVLQGKQGKGKSGAVVAICPKPEWFGDDYPLGQDSKIVIERTQGKMICEAGELKGLSNTEAGALKQELSRVKDKARMAYEREPVEKLREFIIFGTVNDAVFLKDNTGNRRYWPISTKVVDTAGLIAIKEQLWAEACYLDLAYPQQETIRLDPSLYAAAAIEQEQRRFDDPIQVELEAKLGSETTGVKGRIRTQDIWKLLDFERRPTKNEQMQIESAIAAIGFEKTKKTEEDDSSCYARGTEEEQKVYIKLVSTGAKLNVIKGVPAPKPAPADQPN